MMNYGSFGGAGWFWMGFAMIAFWVIVIALVVWAVRASRTSDNIAPPSSAALGLLQERLAKGEISNEEYTERSALIRAAR